MMRLLIVLTCCAALAVGCTITRERQAEIKDAAGTVGTFLGLPRPIGEGVAALVLAGLTAVGGHKNGRRCERNAQAANDDDAPTAFSPPPASDPNIVQLRHVNPAARIVSVGPAPDLGATANPQA